MRRDLAGADPPAGPTGVSINSGERFTNDPAVMLNVTWPALAIDAAYSHFLFVFPGVQRLLDLMGQTLRYDFVEFNSRPYQRMTTISLYRGSPAATCEIPSRLAVETLISAALSQTSLVIC